MNVPSLNEELSAKIQASEKTRRTIEDSFKATDVPVINPETSSVPVKIIPPSTKFQPVPAVQPPFKNHQTFVSQQQHTQMVVNCF